MINNEIKALTSLRFFAALFVFFFHMEIRWHLPAPSFVTNIISQGAIAMSLFFILSGFILTYNYANMQPHREYFKFMVRRFARIYPVYILAACVSIYWIGIPFSGGHHDLAKTGFLFFANIFMVQAWFPALFSYWNDNASWSLSVETFCYFLFPAILYFLLKTADGTKKYILIACYLCAVLPGIAYVLFDPKPLLTTIYAMPIFRLPEFVMGIICCLIFFKSKSDQSTNIKFILTVVLLVSYLSLFGRSFSNIYVIHNFIVIPCFCLIVYYGALLNLKFPVTFLGNRYFKFLGASSYSFYLMQILPIEFGGIIVKRYTFFLTHHWLLAGMLFLINLLLAVICYVFIENPMRKYVINYFDKKKFNERQISVMDS